MGKIKTKQLNPLQHSLETLQDYASIGAKTAVKNSVDTVAHSADDFLDMIGLKSSSETHENQDPKRGEVELYSSEKKHRQESRAHIEYHDEIRKSGEHSSRMENRQLTQQVQEILAELQRLIKSSKTIEMEFAEFAVMDTPAEVGKYDMNFFEWLMITIKQAREKVEDSGAWISAIKGKNGKKGQDYWSMFKKHGTSFGMSNERSTATSVG